MTWIERKALAVEFKLALRSVGVGLFAAVVAGTLGCEPSSATSLSPSGASLESIADEQTAPTSDPAAVVDEAESPAEAPQATEVETVPEESIAAAADSEGKKPKVFSSSRATARPGEAEKISFDDLVIGLQADVVFRPWMMGDRPKELDGKKVRISGYMHAGADPVKTKKFVILRNLECKFGPGGQADHLAQVYMKPGITTHYPGKDPIKVEGTLKIEPFTGTDGNTWSLYKIVDSEVVR